MANKCGSHIGRHSLPCVAEGSPRSDPVDGATVNSFPELTAENEIISMDTGILPGPSERPAEMVLHRVRNPAGHAPKSFDFGAGHERVLGRDAQLADWCVDDPGISRAHAVLRRDRDGLTLCLVDLSSTNGVYVNGERVNAARLSAGDVLRAGDSLFVVSKGDAAAASDRDIGMACRHNAALLLSGESGAGKERLARDIHRQSGSQGRFTSISCAFTSYQQAAALLFGKSDSVNEMSRQLGSGIACSAGQGTVLLKDIGDAPLDTQPLLLRLLDEHRSSVSSDAAETGQCFRIIAATHQSLKRLVEQGRFRLDLYARLVAHEIEIPPLRERRHEILDLLEAIATDIGVQLQVDTDAAEAILLGSWPTNLHGLRRVLAYSTKRSQAISAISLGALRLCEPELDDLWKARRSLERGQTITILRSPSEALRHAATLQKYVDIHRGNITHVAQELGTTRAQVYRWMRRLGIGAVRGGKS
jgi:transcriptional regulator of acetoin/glycerol metabolism